MKAFMLLVTIFIALSGCSETEILTSSFYGEYVLMKSEAVGTEVSTDFLTGVLILTDDSMEMYLSKGNAEISSLRSSVIYGVSSNGRKTITAEKTGRVFEYYHSEAMLITVLKGEDIFAKLYWRMETPY